MYVSFDSRYDNIPMLSIEAEKALIIEYKQKPTTHLANKIILGNWRYVAKVAHTYAKRYQANAYELFQEGLSGMIVALDKFEPSKCYNYPKARFSSYAKMWVQRYMQVFIVNNWSTVSNTKTEAFKALFWKFNGTMISSERWPKRDVSMDDGLDDGTGKKLEFGNLFFNEEDQPNVIYNNASSANTLKETISKMLNAFNEREQEIIKGRFMADDQLTLQELGDKMQVSRERIRQMEVNILAKLTKLAKKFNLQEYV